MRARKSKKRNGFFGAALPAGENRTYSEPILGVGRVPNWEVEANQGSRRGRTEPIPNRPLGGPWGVGLPISIAALNSIMLGTITSAAEYDGWISWGHKASGLMVVPIVLRVVCVYVARNQRF